MDEFAWTKTSMGILKKWKIMKFNKFACVDSHWIFVNIRSIIHMSNKRTNNQIFQAYKL